MARQSVELTVGSLWTRGDASKAPNGSSSKIRNCAFRRGQVEKRPGWLREATLATGSPTRLVRAVYPTTEQIIYGGASLRGAYRDASAVWNDFALGDGIDIRDATVYKDQVWFCSYGDGTYAGATYSFDGTTLTENATTTRVTGATIDTFIGRLFIGAPRFMHTNGGSNLFAFNTAEWTKSGGPPTVSAAQLLTVVNGSTDEIRTASAAYTTGSAEEKVTYVQWIRANVATASVPITLQIQHATSGDVYGSVEYFVQSSTAEPDWISYSVTALVPASTPVDLVLKLQNSASNATNGHTMYLGDTSSNRGAAVFPGRFVYPYGALTSVSATGYTAYADRMYWSEPLDETDWRNENFAVCDETPGPITVVRATKNKIVAYKKDAMWIFRATNSATAPILRENYIDGIGCIAPQSIASLDDVHFFVSENEVYMYDGAAYPTPLAGEGMKDDLFDPDGIVATPVVEVDALSREVWVHVQKYKVHKYSIDQNRWIGYYQLTSPDGSETPFGPTHGQILDLVYMKPAGESKREMWVLYTNDSGVNSIAKLRETQVLDDLDGTERDIVAEYVFQPIQTSRPRQQVTVQVIGLDHRITGDQTGSVTRYAVSLDNGNTFGKYNDVVLSPVTGADTDTGIILVPVHQTRPRLVLKIQHSGKGGPRYFNLTGGQADLLVRGREVQESNPTASSSNL